MANDFEGQPVQQDGSLADAALAMPDLGPTFEEVEQQPRQRTQPRDPLTQQWQPNDSKAKPTELSPETDPEAQGEPDQVSDVDDEYFEITPEKEGEKPIRMKASEVWQKAQDYARLQTEVEDIRRQSIPPQEFDNAIMQTVQARSNLMRQIEMQRSLLQPQPPDVELMNPESPRYNPQAYYHQTRIAQQEANRISQLEQHHQALAAEQQQQMSALEAANSQREKSKLLSFWPELRDEKEATRVRDDLVRHYGKFGITNELISSVHNSAFYALVKDALAYRRGQQAREAAVKVVRAKPKLVRAEARGNQSPINRRAADGYQRLRQSGSLDDAAQALDGLLG